MPYFTSFSSRFLGALAAFALVGGGCKKPQTDTNAAPRASTTTHSAELPPPRLPPRANPSEAASGGIEAVAVPNDRQVLVVLGATKRPIVHLHGMCTEARSDLEAWASSVREEGTIIALDGDVACPNGASGRTWSSDAAALDARIGEAIAAVSAARAVELDPSQIVLVGESMGATRATTLASRFPSKYRRLVLVGGPETPSSKELANAKAVALLAGEKEPQEKMKQGALGLENAGLLARFWELSGANHGSYGSDGAATMREAVSFVAAD